MGAKSLGSTIDCKSLRRTMFPKCLGRTMAPKASEGSWVQEATGEQVITNASEDHESKKPREDN